MSQSLMRTTFALVGIPMLGSAALASKARVGRVDDKDTSVDDGGGRLRGGE